MSGRWGFISKSHKLEYCAPANSASAILESMVASSREFIFARYNCTESGALTGNRPKLIFRNRPCELSLPTWSFIFGGMNFGVFCSKSTFRWFFFLLLFLLLLSEFSIASKLFPNGYSILPVCRLTDKLEQYCNCTKNSPSCKVMIRSL